jgi:4'-phosphopantetheinyl transferase
VTRDVWMGKLNLPLSTSSFGSFFCVAMPSHESLETWGNTCLHLIEFLEYDSLQNTRRKHDYLLRNYCAKKVILSCLKKSLNHAKHLHLDKDTTGQLILTSNRLYYAQLQVNVTHSQTLGFAIAYEGLYPLGMDIEKIDLQKAQMIANTITSYELSLCEASSILSEITLIILWTAKEALCKALGGGLSVFSKVTEVQTIFSYENYMEAHFKYFPGYRAYGFFMEDYILTIVFPYSKRFQLDIHKIWQDLNLDKKPFPAKIMSFDNDPQNDVN